MLSIAFIMSFVVAAVSMILGIFIYTEVSTGIDQSFGEDIEFNNTSDGVWSWREHRSTGLGMIGVAEHEVPSPNRAVIISTESNTAGTIYLFKTFPKEVIEGNDVKMKGFVTTSGTSVPKLTFQIVDGAFDRTSLVDFPDGAVRITKGNGVLDSFQISSLSGSPTITLTPSIGTEDFITIFAANYDAHLTDHNFNGYIEYIEIVGEESITFNSNTVLSAVGGSGQNEYGTFTSPVVDNNPLDNTFVSQVPEAFTRADAIAFTILAIIPITLFFALFTILSPRIEGDAF